MPDRADAIARFLATAHHGPSGDLVVFDQDLVAPLVPWKAEFIKIILAAPDDEPMVLIPSGPDRRNWRRRF
jgi:hypothetical protein